MFIEDLKELIVEVSGGNPGCITTLMKISETDPRFGMILCRSLKHTGSAGWAIWVVYKDIAKFDLTKTCQILCDWSSEFVEIRLEEYIKTKHGWSM